jgi:hypothetical protein
MDLQMMADSTSAIAFLGLGARMLWPAVALVLGSLFFLLAPVVGQAQLGIELTTDKAAYRSGEQVVIRVTLSNLTTQERRLTFNTSQRYDFSITDSSGKEVWRWSKDRMFLMVMGQERLNEKRNELTYSQTFAGQLPPGRYTISGKIVSKPKPFTASVIIIVN